MKKITIHERQKRLSTRDTFSNSKIISQINNNILSHTTEQSRKTVVKQTKQNHHYYS